MSDPRTDWALVTGASSGLGRELAIALAIRGVNLVLAARREEPMRQLAARLTRQYGVEVLVEAIDLAAPDSAATLLHQLDQRHIEVDILVNNAAVGMSSTFVDQPSDHLRAMLQLNVVTFTELAQVFGKRMVARGRGHILLVAGTAAYQPTPILSVYGAAKAFVLSLGEALHVELGSQVNVTVLSPGFMDTDFSEAVGHSAPAWARRNRLSPVKVANIGLAAMFAGKSSVIAGRINRVMAFFGRFLSRHHQAKMVFRMAEI
jgi:short-subunit dehydrogenase